MAITTRKIGRIGWTQWQTHPTGSATITLPELSVLRAMPLPGAAALQVGSSTRYISKTETMAVDAGVTVTYTNMGMVKTLPIPL